MATDQEVNVISDGEESTEDRGPLVQDKELSEVRNMVEEATDNAPASAEDVLAFLEAEDENDEIVSSEESYVDNRVSIARDIRPMIAAWHEYKGAMSQVKANYKLWKIESEISGDPQDQRKDTLVESASRLKKSVDFIEGEIKDAFPQLKGVAFLTRSELLVLPTWMHELLGITIEATPEEQAAAQEALKEQLESSDPQE